MKKNNHYPTILFQCSPSLGLLDSWLSVLSVLRKKLPKANFIFLASNTGIMDQVNLKNDLIKISENTFDKIIFRSDAGILLSTNSFSEAIKLNLRSRIKLFYYALKVLNKFKLKYLYKFIDLIYKFIVSRIYLNSKFDLNLFQRSNYITLFDMTDLFKPYNRDLKKIITRRKNFSLLHGTGIKGVQIRKDSIYKKNLYKDINFKNTTAYLFSKYEVPYYKKFLSQKQIKVYGIPKHDRWWVNYLLNQNKKQISRKKYIFLISRPTSTTLKKSKRIAFLNMIKKISLEYNLKVIIKLHPKELKNDLYKLVFDSGEKKISYMFSSDHPFILGRDCLFAICYYSGVPVDLLKLGIPTIELSDFTGINDDDHEYSLRNNNGEAIREYRYLGLVLGASTYSEFRSHVKNILYNRKNVIKKLQKNYNKVFISKKKINSLISDEIKNNFVYE